MEEKHHRRGVTDSAGLEDFSVLAPFAMPDQPAIAAQPTQIVFIEGNVPDAQALARGVAPGVVAVVLDPGADGIDQMARFLARSGLTGLAAIDIVAHGSDGALTLGTGALNAASLTTYQPQLATIGAALAPGAALQLYGCDVAEDASGVAFIDGLSAAIGGATVAASSHLVGAASLGGSWTLDVTTGADGAGSPFTASAESSYQGILPTPIFTSLYSFATSPTGVTKSPYTGLLIDSNGNLLGTTTVGTNTLFEMTRNGNGTYNAPTFFGGTLPSYGNLIADPNGNLYGTSYTSPGSVFEIDSPSGGTYASTVNVLTITGDFSAASPAFTGPQGSVYRDANGNLIGSANAGGAHSDGGVWELAYNGTGAVGSSSSYTYSKLFDFTGTGTTGAPGQKATGGFIADASGNLYGTTSAGGANGYGEVYEIKYSSGTYATAPTVLYSFASGSSGGGPNYGTLAMDAVGDLFGTTFVDGANSKGSIFELKKSGGSYSYVDLYDAAANATGYNPDGSVLLDTSGNLYGTFSVASGATGIVWELPYTGTGNTSYATSPTVLVSLSGATGSFLGTSPRAGLVADSNGNLLGTTFSGGSSTTGGTVFEISGLGVVPLCFCHNTLIGTPRGQVLATRYRRTAASPVIVRKGALAPNVPTHDLRVTKAHALYVDDVLIPAEYLINHRSILWDDHAQGVEIFHIELDSHDILLANGAPAESYRDDGNRWLFANANPGWEAAPEPPYAPVLTGGPVVDAIWRRLLDRCGPLPTPALTDDPDLHLIADGVRIEASARSQARWTFALPRGLSSLCIVSRAAAPAELGLARDPRMLGVAVRQITMFHRGRLRTVRYDNPVLGEAGPETGWHEIEHENGWRWTSGDAQVPTALIRDRGDAFALEIVVASFARYRDEAATSGGATGAMRTAA